jgi:hypothetical protein
MSRMVLLVLLTGLLYGCSASAMISQLKFEPVNPKPGNTQVQDEAQCRKEFNQYRTGINSNWLSDEIYKDCMIAKGYKELK